MHEEYYQSAEDQWRTVCALYNPDNWTKELIADPTLFYRLLYDGNSYRSPLFSTIIDIESAKSHIQGLGNVGTIKMMPSMYYLYVRGGQWKQLLLKPTLERR